MTLAAATKKIAFAFLLSFFSGSCTMRYKCDAHASSIALVRPTGRNKDSLSGRVSAYLPSGERKSGFEITHIDSISEAPGCGNPLFATALTLGLVPSSIPIRFDVAVRGRDQGVAQKRWYWVALEGHYSIWESLIPPSSDDRAIARGLLDAVDRDQRSPEEFRSNLIR